MKTQILLFFFIFTFVTLSLHGQEIKKQCISCERLKELRLPDVTIIKIESLKGDTIRSGVDFIPDDIIKVPFCRVLGRISKEINFEILVPQQWNGRFLMSGGGGFVGSIQNWLNDYVNQGFATAGTDTGHQGNGMTADWALNNMERQLNFGRLAVHRTAVVSKAILNSVFCSGPDYSYFIGCSRGGGQAMIEAQSYPDDFNGIVAGAPAFQWPAMAAQFVKGCKAIYPNPSDLKSVITNENLKLLQNIILQQCDNLDGISDRIINDPRDCKIDLDKLPHCPDNKSNPSCFTKKQIEAIKSIYNPTIVDNKMVYPGFPFGLEAEVNSWDVWNTGNSPLTPNMPSFHYMLGTDVFKYFVYNDPSWDYSKYEFSNFLKDTQYASTYLDASQTDYSEFKRMKSKMIIYHGWNDAAVSAYATIQHYEEALKKDADLHSYIRLFLLPGVMHCEGGTGPDKIDWVKLIRDWVEQGTAPERIILSKVEKEKTIMTRPVFPYPKLTVYSGKGDTDLEKNFKEKDNR